MYRLSRDLDYDQCHQCDGTGYVDVFCSWTGRDSIECLYYYGTGWGLQGLIMTGRLHCPEEVSAFVEAV